MRVVRNCGIVCSVFGTYAGSGLRCERFKANENNGTLAWAVLTFLRFQPGRCLQIYVITSYASRKMGKTHKQAKLKTN